MKKIITVDGPAGSGKEKISRYIARKYRLHHLDSGTLYRRLAYELSKKNIKCFEIDKIRKFIKNIKNISIRKTQALRKEEVGKAASEIAKLDFVRYFINSQQRLATKAPNKKKGFIIDGRDIGSVVFKKAFLKLYIDVDVNIRAKRRYKQLIDNGEKSIYLKILKDIKLRDKTDKTRINSPLVVPKGAKIIDNSHTFKNTIAQIRNIIEGIN